MYFSIRCGKKYEQLQNTKDKPVRRIMKLVDSFVQKPEEPVNNTAAQKITDINGQRGLPDRDSTSRSRDKVPADSPNKETPPKRKNPIRKLEGTFPRFGPCCEDDTDPMVALKDEAWEHVLEMTKKDESALEEVEKEAIEHLYHNSMKKVEKEAKDLYDPKIVKPLKGKKFRDMMLKDGCLFLQLALYILGGPKHLGYPEDHPVFGEVRKENMISNWLKAMFLVGNQIPCVVLHKLMKQSFFQMVIQKGGPWIPPSELPQLTLYLVVVQPMLQRNGYGPSRQIFSKLNGENRTPYHLKETTSDILHCLHTIVLGNGKDPLDSHDWEVEEDLDLDLDLESGLEEFDKKKKFPSASEIKQSGIRIRKGNWGIREIHFTKKFLLLGYLYVPPFTFDMNTDLLLRNLKNYEVGQQQCTGKVKREVAAYLRFMRDLIQTERDVSLLESKGIIKIKKEDQKDELPGMLNKIISPEEVPFTRNLRRTRLKVTEYNNPPCYLISWALIFTLVQTVFTILQYFEPRD